MKTLSRWFHGGESKTTMRECKMLKPSSSFRSPDRTVIFSWQCFALFRPSWNLYRYKFLYCRMEGLKDKYFDISSSSSSFLFAINHCNLQSLSTRVNLLNYKYRPKIYDHSAVFRLKDMIIE